MITFFLIFLVFFLSIYLFLRHPKFGKHPTVKRLERIRQSPNYKNGQFQNQSITPQLTEDATYYSVIKKVLFKESKRTVPVDEIPSIKTDLLHLDIKEDLLVWFGHSSYFIQIDGKRILVDPVFSGCASPVSFTTRAFKGTDRYTTDDIPEIDYLFITHDHWDHLDFETIIKLKTKIRKVICSLGTGEHFEYWGYDSDLIIEKDWNETAVLDDGFNAHFVPARHFSGRTLKRNKALWTAFVLETPTKKILIGGDSGYDKHFAEIGHRFGSIDLAILEMGQYDKSWKYIHLQPEEFLIAAKELNAQRILPVHNSKFALGNHDWDEPMRLLSEINKKENLNVITPMIGEKVDLRDNEQQFSRWWEGVM